jgi:hypothetical protein
MYQEDMAVLRLISYQKNKKIKNEKTKWRNSQPCVGSFSTHAGFHKGVNRNT